jgi:hypothetical protein
MNMQTSDFRATYTTSRSSGLPQGLTQQPTPLINNLDIGGMMNQGTSGMMNQGTSGMQQMQGMQGGPSLPGSGMPMADQEEGVGMAADSVQFLNGFLRTQIGNRVKVEFLVGANTYLEKSGKLLAVGANFIILQEAMTDDLLVCDFFNIKFVTIYR